MMSTVITTRSVLFDETPSCEYGWEQSSQVRTERNNMGEMMDSHGGGNGGEEEGEEEYEEGYDYEDVDDEDITEDEEDEDEDGIDGEDASGYLDTDETD
ncbi:hypothetical protein N7456_005797 [Penicillium angulare]|uniref:Uncharacterized protein n=1 Tax=Penicillium angulare TaxID=116970 RepID=A0A9W9FZ70_9EURO|nr:hypothetical protein N7456_005797 [Penicillium angulare]